MITSMRNMHIRQLLLAVLLAAPLLIVAAPAPAPAPAPAQDIQIRFETRPNPPHSGKNTVEVTVLDTAGMAITNAMVEVRFHMAAMPSMNMPEMSATVVTKHAGKGRYRGEGKLVMGGTWEVTVTVMLDGTRLGRKKFIVNAKG